MCSSPPASNADAAARYSPWVRSHRWALFERWRSRRWRTASGKPSGHSTPSARVNCERRQNSSASCHASALNSRREFRSGDVSRSASITALAWEGIRGFVGFRIISRPAWRTHSCVPRSQSCERFGTSKHVVLARVPTRHAEVRAWPTLTKMGRRLHQAPESTRTSSRATASSRSEYCISQSCAVSRRS
jgi:hypothetical protein